MSSNLLSVYESGNNLWNNFPITQTSGLLLVSDSTQPAGIAWSDETGLSIGTVTSVTIGTGLSSNANPITTSGTINIADTGVTGVSASSPFNISYNAQGQLTGVSPLNLSAMGFATLSSSTATVANTNVNLSTSVVEMNYTGGITPSTVGVLSSIVTTGVGFVINSNKASDNNPVAYRVYY